MTGQEDIYCALCITHDSDQIDIASLLQHWDCWLAWWLLVMVKCLGGMVIFKWVSQESETAQGSMLKMGWTLNGEVLRGTKTKTPLLNLPLVTSLWLLNLQIMLSCLLQLINVRLHSGTDLSLLIRIRVEHVTQLWLSLWAVTVTV